MIGRVWIACWGVAAVLGGAATASAQDDLDWLLESEAQSRNGAQEPAATLQAASRPASDLLDRLGPGEQRVATRRAEP